MIEVLKQMTEALEDITRLLQGITGGTFSKLDAAIQAGRQAIREHAMYEVQRLGQEIEQEPVATVTSETGADITMSWWHEPALPIGTKLYTHPPQRTWQGLTDKEREEATGWSVEHIEAKLKQKNGFAEEKNT